MILSKEVKILEIKFLPTRLLDAVAQRMTNTLSYLKNTSVKNVFVYYRPILKGAVFYE